MAPTLMLGFGLISAVMGVREYVRIQANPAPLTVACDAAAIESASADRWVVVEGCEPLLADIFERTEGDDIEQLLVPLRPDEAASDAPPAALLSVRDTVVLRAYEDMPGEEGSDAESSAAAEAFFAKLDLERIEGVTSSRYGKEGDPQLDLLRQRFDLPPAGVISIERDRVPKQSMMLVSLVAGIILLPLGIVYLLRARKSVHEASRSGATV
ncbi:MAG: hypothetical protein AAF721_03335 [Myxococcota bacterium]